MKTLILPDDQGVHFPSYINRWEKLSQFEKILYYWLEVNSRGWEIMVRSKSPIIHIKYEEIFSEQKMIELTRFLGVHFKKEIIIELDKNVDQYNYKMKYAVRQDLRSNHPDVFQLMTQLNY